MQGLGTTLLLSTFTRLLQVRLGPRQELLDVGVIDEGLGIYFGLTTGGGTLYAVARNLDIRKEVQDPRLPTNALLVYRPPWRAGRRESLELPGAADLHQIRLRDGLLWVVSGASPELLAFDPDTGRPAGQLALGNLVPPDLRREAPAAHPGDRYHFNSLHFAPGRLLALAHNWDEGSFALELAYEGPGPLFARPRLLGVHRGLGTASHDVLWSEAGLYVLDSGGGRLLGPAGATCALDRGGERPFPRGLAAGRTHLFVGHGSCSDDREGRLRGPSWLRVLRRDTLEEEAAIEVGPHGNTCDCLLLSEPDLTDGAEPATWWLRPLRPFLRKREFDFPASG
ncbi:MAG: hypothetical protein U0797_25285 [Gemmataceae bacterium]